MRHPLYDSEVKAVLTFIHQGFNAVEADNLDTFTRTDLLTQDGNFALAKTLADYAHSHNLAFGQKNAAEYSKDAKAAVGFDVSVLKRRINDPTSLILRCSSRSPKNAKSGLSVMTTPTSMASMSSR